MLSRFQSGDRHLSVGADRGHDVDGVDLLDLEQILESGEASLHLEQIPDLVHLLLVTLTNRVTLGIRVLLVQGNKFGAEPESYHGYSDFFSRRHTALLPIVAGLNQSFSCLIR